MVAPFILSRRFVRGVLPLRRADGVLRELYAVDATRCDSRPLHTPSTRYPAQDFGDGEKNPNLITPEKYNELVKKHVMFKDMAADTYLASAGIADDWPYGRGCWQSDDLCGNQPVS